MFWRKTSRLLAAMDAAGVKSSQRLLVLGLSPGDQFKSNKSSMMKKQSPSRLTKHQIKMREKFNLIKSAAFI